MTNEKEKTKKIIIKEGLKEIWDWYKWGVYIGFIWLVILFFYDSVKKLFE